MIDLPEFVHILLARDQGKRGYASAARLTGGTHCGSAQKSCS